MITISTGLAIERPTIVCTDYMYLPLFSSLSVDPSQFDNHSNLCRSIFGSCVTGVTEFGLQIHFKELILCMTHRDMLTSEEVDQLKDESVSMSDKAMNLTINILPSKGEMFKPISLFYSCLMESAMTEDGLEDHYYLTQRLRESGEFISCR